MGLIHRKKKINYEDYVTLCECYATQQEELTKLKKQVAKLEKQLKEEKPTVKVIKTNTLSEEDKKRIELEYARSLTPTQLVQAFAGDVEEFYPNGKPTN